MGKIRVLHIITRLDDGGSPENTITTCTGLDKEKYSVALVTGPSKKKDPNWQDRIRQSGVEVMIVPSLTRNIRPLKDLRAFLQLIRIMRRGRYHMVHTHTSKAGIVGRFAAWLCNVPVIVHQSHGHVFYGYFDPIKSALFVILEKIAAILSARVVTLTDSDWKDRLSLGIGKPDLYISIHSGVKSVPRESLHPDEAGRRRELGVPPDAFLIGSAGRLERVKGYRYLVEAAPLVIRERPDAYFLVAGEGELRRPLEEMAERLGVAHRIRFAGWHDDIFELMAALDMFVLTSLNEGMGRVLVEAMMMGLPIVATGAGGIPEVLENGRCGLIVPPANPEMLAEAILKLMGDEKLRSVFRERGPRRARDFTLEKMLEKMEMLYSELLEEAGLSGSARG